MDYCTDWFEGWWQTCCKIHDDEYTAQIGKALADSHLMQCVSDSLPAFAVANPILSTMFGIASAVIGAGMYKAVQVFGKRFYTNAAKEDPPKTTIVIVTKAPD